MWQINILNFKWVRLAHAIPDVSDAMFRWYFGGYTCSCLRLCMRCSESAGGWCCLDAGHTDIFVAKVGMSHCMSMSPSVTPVWLLQEMTQISPSVHRDTQRWRRQWYMRRNHFRDMMFSDNLHHVCTLVVHVYLCVSETQMMTNWVPPTHKHTNKHTPPLF